MEEINEGTNQFFDIFIRTRQTIRNIIETDAGKLVFPLAIVGGISDFLSRLSEKNLGDSWELLYIIVFAIFGGPLLGIIGLFFKTALVGWTGKWIGGKGDSVQIQAAIAWSYAPNICILFAYIIAIFIFGKEVFQSETPRIDLSLALTIGYGFFGLVQLIFGIWSFVILVKCLSEVQGFSVWRATANVILPSIVVVAPILVIVFLVRVLLP